MHKPIVVFVVFAFGSICHHWQSLHIPQSDAAMTITLQRGESGFRNTILVQSCWRFSFAYTLARDIRPPLVGEDPCGGVTCAGAPPHPHLPPPGGKACTDVQIALGWWYGYCGRPRQCISFEQPEYALPPAVDFPTATHFRATSMPYLLSNSGDGGPTLLRPFNCDAWGQRQTCQVKGCSSPHGSPQPPARFPLQWVYRHLHRDSEFSWSLCGTRMCGRLD
jgi:hypothetical protein